MVETSSNFPSILLGQQFVKQNCPTSRLCVPAEPKIFSPLLAVCSSQIVILEKDISRIRIVLLLCFYGRPIEHWKERYLAQNKRLKIEAYFVSPYLFWCWVLAREPVFQPRGTAVDVIISIFIRIRPSTLSRKIYGFVFIHFRERFQTYTDSVDPIRVLVHRQTNLTVRVRLRDVMKFTPSVIPYIYYNLQRPIIGVFWVIAGNVSKILQFLSYDPQNAPKCSQINKVHLPNGSCAFWCDLMAFWEGFLRDRWCRPPRNKK